MFGKLEATASINTTGVGLGLSICRKIVEALDGYIYLEDREEKHGTKFVFVIRLTERVSVEEPQSLAFIDDIELLSRSSFDNTRALLKEDKTLEGNIASFYYQLN